MNSQPSNDVVTVSPEAKDYILKNGGAVTIRLVKGQGGCCSMLSPVVETRKPTDISQFRQVDGDQISLYLQEGLEVLPGGVKIGLNKLLWIKRLDIHGLDILP